MLQQLPFLAFPSLLAVLPRPLGHLLQPFPVLPTELAMDLAVQPEPGRLLICYNLRMPASPTTTLMVLAAPPELEQLLSCLSPNTKASLT